MVVHQRIPAHLVDAFDAIEREAPSSLGLGGFTPLMLQLDTVRSVFEAPRFGTPRNPGDAPLREFG